MDEACPSVRNKWLHLRLSMVIQLEKKFSDFMDSDVHRFASLRYKDQSVKTLLLTVRTKRNVWALRELSVELLVITFTTAV
jgi:hypothetical protein